MLPRRAATLAVESQWRGFLHLLRCPSLATSPRGRRCTTTMATPSQRFAMRAPLVVAQRGLGCRGLHSGDRGQPWPPHLAAVAEDPRLCSGGVEERQLPPL
eukprot:RCo037143